MDTLNAVKSMNRIGYPALTCAGIGIHTADKLMPSLGLRETIPLVANHVGDFGYECLAVLSGFTLANALEATHVIGHDQKKAVALITTGILFGLIILNETTGFGGGTPDYLFDLPGAVIGVLGAAACFEAQTPVVTEPNSATNTSI